MEVTGCVAMGMTFSKYLAEQFERLGSIQAFSLCKNKANNCPKFKPFGISMQRADNRLWHARVLNSEFFYFKLQNDQLSKMTAISKSLQIMDMERPTVFSKLFFIDSFPH